MYKYLSKYLLLMGQARVSVTRGGVGECHWWMPKSLARAFTNFMKINLRKTHKAVHNKS